MRKILQSLLVLGLSMVAYSGKAQINYSPAGAANLQGTYTALTSADGQPISTTNNDDGLSSAIPIGFTFNFNGKSFTDFVLSTNGFIKLGNSSPSNAALFFLDVQSYTNFPLTSQNPADTNLIFAFGYDLEPSIAAPVEFRSHSTGNPGSRVLTIQWQGMSDKTPILPAGLFKQYASMDFQLKLYEGTNRIEVVIGNFIPSTQTAAFRGATVGLKGTGFTSNDLLYFTKASADNWLAAFASRSLPLTLAFNFRNNVNPTPGQTYRFDPQLTDDLSNLGVVNTLNNVCGTSTPVNISMRIRNLGVNSASGYTVSYQKIGGTVITETVGGSLPPNTDTIYTFTTPFTLSANGDSLRTWVSLTGDANNTNDTSGYRINVISPISTFPYTQEFTNPLGWTVNQITAGSGSGSPNGGWQFQTGGMLNPTFNPGSGYAFFNSYNLAAGLRSRLIFPCGFNLSGLTNPRISFNMTRDGGYAGQGIQAYSPDRVVILVSTDNGLTFNAVDSVIRPDSTLGSITAVSWNNYLIDLSQVANQNNVLIAVDAISEYGTNIALDSLVIFNGIPTSLDTLSAFSLIGPATGTAITLPATPLNYPINWNRSVRSGPGTAVTYAWLVALANGSFNSPLATIPANNNGLDSVLTLNSTAIDNLLAANNILPGQTANLKWTIRATSGNKTRLANTEFLINITRRAITDTLRAFALVSPTNNSTLNLPLSGSGTIIISWRRSATVSGNPVTYEWLVDAPGGNFSNPLVALASNNSGADSALSLSYNQLNTLLNANGVLPGQTYNAIWTVRATSNNLIRFANAAFNINIFRINDTLAIFNLLTPANNTNFTATGAPSQILNITWRRTQIANSAPVTYSWLLESPNGNFTNPIATILSNNSGADSVLTLTYGQIATLLAANNIQAGATLNAKWSVRATAGTAARLAATPFNITLAWNFLTSTPSIHLNDRIILYPNPSKAGESRLKVNLDQASDLQIQVTDLQGRVLNASIEKGVSQTEVILPTMGLSPGMYLVVVQNGAERIVRKLQLN